ncbi:zinc-binding alcohol dehydrogenase family protein [Aspergillus stella-maris]|uniref:zinc-binding alcohol dehydrogenase family protein n=1 Tax=Aspergillus stella-maris TaxID=1810926 RepID=UPI003CCE4664
MTTHLAAILPSKNTPFTLQNRPTPTPGPGELLIAVKSVALNPADTIMRSHGLFIQSYPTVIGFDISGLVIDVGEGVPVPASNRGDSEGPVFEPGLTRVAAYAAAAWKGCDPDYGAFQEKCLVPWEHAVPIPDYGEGGSLSWNEAATLPVAVQVPLNAWDALGIPRMDTIIEPDIIDANEQGKQRQKKNALLIWGASSSVGTMGVQTARLLRDEQNPPFTAVYATAGAANHSYIRSLGADRVFDYKNPNVVEDIIAAAREDGIVIRHCFLAVGQLAQCQAVLEAFRESEKHETSKIASAPPVPADAKVVNGVETIFVQPCMDEEAERLAQFRYWMGTWLRKSLEIKTIRPSPEVEVVGRGLETLNAGLDELLRGVSCTKLVVEVAK